MKANNDGTKQCSKCRQVKLVECFTRDGRRSDGLNSHCKECIKANPPVYSEEAKARRATKVGKASRELKLELVGMLGGKCSHCGYSEYLAALDFHHLGDKEGNVGAMTARAANSKAFDREVLFEEVRKCVILCSNCHRGLHAGEWSE